MGGGGGGCSEGRGGSVGEEEGETIVKSITDKHYGIFLFRFVRLAWKLLARVGGCVGVEREEE